MAAAVAPGAAPVLQPAEAQGLRRPGHALLVSPGVLALELRDPGFRMYAWGLSGGRMFTGAGPFAALVGGSLEHNVWINRLDPERGDRARALSFLRFGPELRIDYSVPYDLLLLRARMLIGVRV